MSNGEIRRGLCVQHSGHEARIENLELENVKQWEEINAVDKRVNSILTRINIVLGSIVVAIVLLLVNISVAHSETQTINTVPSADATFISDLQTFLRDEDAQREQRLTRVVSGGIGTTDASLTHTISTVVAYIEGYYVTDASVSHTYTASKDTFVLLRYNDTTTVTIAGAAITYDGNFVFAEMANGTAQPNAPAGTMMLFEVVTDGSSITTVNDYRTGGIVFLSDPTFADGSDGRLKDAVDTIGVVPTTLYIDCDDNISANTTVPITMQLYFVNNGVMLFINNGVTLTINGPFDVGLHQVFDVSSGGIVVFDGKHTKEVIPQWWGALADGSTDDTTAIQAALDTGCDTFFPGTSNYYKISSTLTIDNNNQTIFGVGELSKLVQSGTNANASVFVASGVTGVTFKNLYAVPNTTTATVTDGYGFTLLNSLNSKVTGCTVSDHRRGGIFIYSSSYCIVSNNVIRNSVYDPVTETHGDSGHDISVGYGNANFNTIIGNTIEDGAAIGIALQTVTSGATVNSNSVTGNTISGEDGYGIMLYRLNAADTLYGNVISGNTVKDITGDMEHATNGFIYGAGIYVQGAEYTSITGNSIDTVSTNANIVETLSPAGIGTANVRNVTITGNVIKDSGHHGIALFDPNETGLADGTAIVTGNIVQDSTETGIYCKDFPRAIISNNKSVSNGIHGIRIIDSAGTTSDYFIIRGNECSGNTSTGITITDGDSVISNNICDTNGAHGITVAGTGKHIIIGNYVLSNTSRGIQVVSGITDAVVSGNIVSGNNDNIVLDGPTKTAEENILLNGVTSEYSGTYGPSTVLADDATPSVKHGKTFVTGGVTTITDFDDGVEGQIITIVSAHTVTITDGTNILLNGSVDYNMTANDTLTLINRSDGKWSELARQVD